MDFNYNRNSEGTVKVMKSKGKKNNIKVVQQDKKHPAIKLEISLGDDGKKQGEGLVPVIFKGKISDNDKGSTLTGKFNYGFYLYTLVIVAAILIVVRFGFSLYNMQKDNMLLCGIVTVLLIILIAVVLVKSKPDREHITEFLNNLNKK